MHEENFSSEHDGSIKMLALLPQEILQTKGGTSIESRCSVCAGDGGGWVGRAVIKFRGAVSMKILTHNNKTDTIPVKPVRGEGLLKGREGP